MRLAGAGAKQSTGCKGDDAIHPLDLPHCWQTTIFPIWGPAGNLVALPYTRHASFAWHLSRWLQPSLCASGTTGLLVVGSRSGVLPPGHATPSAFASPCSSFKCAAHRRLPLPLRRQGRRHRCMWQLQRLMPEMKKCQMPYIGRPCSVGLCLRRWLLLRMHMPYSCTPHFTHCCFIQRCKERPRMRAPLLAAALQGQYR